MDKKVNTVFQIAAVFIGTIVGAGLASGKETSQFFTSYGYKSYIGIIACGIFYILICSLISKISAAHNLNSYSDLMYTVSPNFFSKITGTLITLYLISSSSIILAGSGALLNQFFGIPKIVGTLIMAAVALITLLRDTSGLIEINSVIVPSLLIVIFSIFTLYLLLDSKSMTLANIKLIPPLKPNGLTWSTIIYIGFNITCCSGVIVPLSTKIKDHKSMKYGIMLGAIGLTLLCIMINSMLIVNQPHIFKCEIPLLYAADRFGKLIQAILLVIIWCEMFSTEVSDVYSISRSLDTALHINYKKAIFLVILIDLPISQIGFSNLISTLYPIFGLLSLVFIVQCIYYYFKHKKELKISE